MNQKDPYLLYWLIQLRVFSLCHRFGLSLLSTASNGILLQPQMVDFLAKNRGFGRSSYGVIATSNDKFHSKEWR